MDSTAAPAPSPLVIADSTPYVVIDTRTKREAYRTTYANRHLARAWRDRKDSAYGATRYSCRVLAS